MVQITRAGPADPAVGGVCRPVVASRARDAKFFEFYFAIWRLGGALVATHRRNRQGLGFRHPRETLGSTRDRLLLMKLVLSRCLRVFAKVWYGLVAVVFVLAQIHSCAETGALLGQESIVYIVLILVLLSPGFCAASLARRMAGSQPDPASCFSARAVS